MDAAAGAASLGGGSGEETDGDSQGAHNPVEAALADGASAWRQFPRGARRTPPAPAGGQAEGGLSAAAEAAVAEAAAAAAEALAAGAADGPEELAEGQEGSGEEEEAGQAEPSGDRGAGVAHRQPSPAGGRGRDPRRAPRQAGASRQPGAGHDDEEEEEEEQEEGRRVQPRRAAAPGKGFAGPTKVLVHPPPKSERQLKRELQTAAAAATPGGGAWGKAAAAGMRSQPAPAAPPVGAAKRKRGQPRKLQPLMPPPNESETEGEAAEQEAAEGSEEEREAAEPPRKAACASSTAPAKQQKRRGRPPKRGRQPQAPAAAAEEEEPEEVPHAELTGVKYLKASAAWAAAPACKVWQGLGGLVALQPSSITFGGCGTGTGTLASRAPCCSTHASPRAFTCFRRRTRRACRAAGRRSAWPTAAAGPAWRGCSPAARRRRSGWGCAWTIFQVRRHLGRVYTPEPRILGMPAVLLNMQPWLNCQSCNADTANAPPCPCSRGARGAEQPAAAGGAVA